MSTRHHIAHVRRWIGPLDWYLEDDHLLAVDQRFFERRYRRFYFADIRSLVIWPNQNLWIHLGVAAFIAFLAWLIAFNLRSPRAEFVILALAALIMAPDILLGHRAGARIETMHSGYRAPLVNRWRQAPAMLDLLRSQLPRIAAPEPIPESALPPPEARASEAG